MSSSNHVAITLYLWCVAFSVLHPVDALSTVTTTAGTAKPLPTPLQWPLVGNLPDFFMRGGPEAMFDVHASLYKEFGPYYGLSLIGNDMAIACDPREYEKVYHAEGKYPHGSSQEAPVFLEYHEMRENEYVAKSMKDGEEWRTWRQKLNRDLFLKSSARSYTPAIAAAASQGSRYASAYEDKMDDFISRMAWDMFNSIIFGPDGNPGTVNPQASDDDLQVVRDTQEAFSLAGVITLSPQEKIFKSNRYDTFVNSMDRSMDFAQQRTLEFVKKAREQKERQDIADPVVFQEMAALDDETTTGEGEEKEASCPFSSAIDRLVSRNEMVDDEIAETVGSLLQAGVDTTAYILGWLWINIARSPDAQSKLVEELDSLLGGADVSETDLDNLPFLRACIRESHRLTPPGPLSHTRRLKKDITIGGYDYPAGMLLAMNINAFQMDPKYVDQPTQYKPERWLPDAVAQRKGTPQEVIDHRLLASPFGAGARMCLGHKLAEIEIAVATARLFQDWKVTLDPPNQQWNLKQGLFVKADPFPRFLITPRM